MSIEGQKCNIGILTYHGSYNYGAFLQAFSLCSRLNQEPGIHAEIIDYNMPSALRMYDPAYWSLLKKASRFRTLWFQYGIRKAFSRGREKLGALLSEASLLSDDVEAFTKYVYGKYDVIIAGSDEIWKLQGVRGFPSAYWLPGDLGCKKVSYAASSRSDWHGLTEQMDETLKRLLDDFELVSVRDQLTYDMAAHYIGDSRVRLDCDPSFLYKKAVDAGGAVLKKKARIDDAKKTVVLMLDDRQLADQIVGELGRDRYNLVSVFKKNGGCVNIADLDPFEWLELIAGADFVISSFFHATCYSIIYDTPFLALGTPKKRSKLEELLVGSELSGHYVPVDAASKYDWESLIQMNGDTTGFQGFAERQRVGFDDYLKRLYGVIEGRN